MRQFFTLYRFEIKKIFQKPYVPALLALSIALTLFLNVRPLLGEQTVAYVDEQQQFHLRPSAIMRPSSWSAALPGRTPGSRWTTRRSGPCRR